MKAMSWTLFLLGTLIAAATGAHLPPIWPLFAVGIALALVGAILLRRIAATGVGDGDGEGIGSVPELQAALQGLHDTVVTLAAQEPGEGMRAGLEQTLLESLVPALEARSLLASAHGVEAYARVFTPVATAERCLNRAWSASADGVPDEATSELSKAVAHLAHAIQAFPASTD